MNFSIKYRPITLSEIKGHDKVIKDLTKRSKNNDFPQTMMFSGKTGNGKTSLTRIIAKNILCQHKDEKGNSCNSCELCMSIDQEKLSFQYFEYNASNLGIDEMRAIEEQATKKVLGQSQKKVIVIDELQELGSNRKAMKNILKILEKPLKNTFFILGTMEEWRVDKSIKNRSVPYRLHDLDTKTILDYLIYVCDKEKVIIDTPDKANVLVALANYSNGSMRTAVSLLERVVYSEIWNPEDALKELGILTDDKLISIVNGILTGDVSVLENKITEDLLDRINDILNTYFKVLSGLKNTNFVYRDNLQGITKVSIETVTYTISKLNELMKFIYLKPNLIEFVILDIINNNKIKQIKEEKFDEIPKRRRINL